MSDTFTCQFCGEKLPSADTFHDLASCYAHLKVRIDSLEAENARLKEENERLYLLYQEAVEIIESAMDERCSWCMGKDGKHEPDCEANNWLMSSPNKTQEVKE